MVRSGARFLAGLASSKCISRPRSTSSCPQPLQFVPMPEKGNIFKVPHAGQHAFRALKGSTAMHVPSTMKVTMPVSGMNRLKPIEPNHHGRVMMMICMGAASVIVAASVLRGVSCIRLMLSQSGVPGKFTRECFQSSVLRSVIDMQQLDGDASAMRKWFIVMMLLVISAGCAKKPPLQEMAEARSAIEAVKQLPVEGNAGRHLEQAEEALDQASEAIGLKEYGTAHSKALEAKRKAQEAACIQRGKHDQ